MVLDTNKDYKKSKQSVLDYQMLDNYYTSNGFYSDRYSMILSDMDELSKYSEKSKSMKNNEEAFLCDSSALDLKQSQNISSEIPEYMADSVIANINYLDNFADITISGKTVDVKNINTRTAFISEKYRDIKDEVIDYIGSEFDRLENYDIFYGLEISRTEDLNFDIVYVDESSTIKCNTSKGFEDINAGIIIVDIGKFGGLYYMDCLNARSLFYELGSRDEFSLILSRYDMDSVVASGTLLTPYLDEMENVSFVLKTFTVFAVVFVISLMFIIYISGYIDIIVNKSRYALKDTLGFSHTKILGKRYVMLFAELMLILVLGMIKSTILCAAVAVMADLILHEVLYRLFISKKMHEIVKGA